MSACKRSGCKGEAVTAERQEVPNSTLRVGPSVLAEFIEAKCDDGLPVHRQCDGLRARIWGGLGAEAGVLVPVAGRERSVGLGTLRVSYRF